MKKIIVLILLILFSLPVFAEYKPIPKDKQAQYKIEVEKYIDKQVPVAENEVKNTLQQVEIMYNKFLTDKNRIIKSEEYSDPFNQYNLQIDSSHTKIYIDLINITKKYADIENFIPATSCVQDLDLFIMPYLKNNNVKNIEKLIKLYELTSSALTKIYNYTDSISDYYLFEKYFKGLSVLPFFNTPKWR